MKLQNIHKKIYITIFLLCIILVSVFSGFVPVEHLDNNNDQPVSENKIDVHYANTKIGGYIKSIFQKNLQNLQHNSIQGSNADYDSLFDKIKEKLLKNVNNISLDDKINQYIQEVLCEEGINAYCKKKI